MKGKPLHTKLIDVGSDVEGEKETVPEKRLRLAKEYLLQLDEEGESCHDSTGWSLRCLLIKLCMKNQNV